MSFEWSEYVCACGHWAADHIIPADEEQPASDGPCRRSGCECTGMHDDNSTGPETSAPVKREKERTR